MKEFRLWLLDFDSAMALEEGWYVLKSKKQPTEEEALKALYSHTYTGTIYYNGSDEIFEIDMRRYDGHITLMEEVHIKTRKKTK